MVVKIPYIDRKEAIRDVLMDRARSGKTITYGGLGKIVGIPARGPWKPILDHIGREGRAKGEPDITFLVINTTYKLPGQIGFKEAKPPTAAQRLEDRKRDEKSVCAV